MSLITDPWFYALAIPGFLINGISKGGFASGAGNVAVPLMAAVVPAPQAVGISLPVLCVMDVAGLRAWWGKWSVREMRAILPAGLVGIAIGSLTFGLFSAKGISLMLGILTLAFLARSLWQRVRGLLPPPAAPNRLKAWICGTASGLTSTLAHTGGPPLAMYLYPLKLDRQTLAATTTVFFGVMNYAKLLPYWGLGLLDWTNLLTSLVLIPLAPIGVYLGIWLQKRISDHSFYNVVYVLLAITGTKLIWDGLS
ncbi:sulfite exporter TauE/SafE family protein [Roseomonas xinghualingensis]|uniref:sulfite exporter TauE/SafE family protein n=1 Tax=Roseomonas xinghualingensis TaxID=2986475 RepID=UPI0021F155C4|nr:sulfite exporter TauE/SafE family protein [Roseomonas sp. SXEYE001]MCV4206977.1 sulfite exporter TauE/SafE family protein [Roseomonas sp. SXEYE001]